MPGVVSVIQPSNVFGCECKMAAGHFPERTPKDTKSQHREEKAPGGFLRTCRSIGLAGADNVLRGMRGPMASQAVHHGQEVVPFAAGIRGRIGRLQRLAEFPHDLGQLGVGSLVLWGESCPEEPLHSF